jgi:1-aminocyclopropane-1-carboxylate deaminase/D-cysteine desulfhydrase-like pyridoxal-dependent ACC family enzyme
LTELIFFETVLEIDHVVCASGSTGTHAGLITGFCGNNSNIPVIGINVSRPKAEQEELVYDLVRKGYFQEDENILYVHTGGSPALYGYMEEVLEESHT